MYKKQKDRKKRKSLLRYFRLNEGGTDYISIPSLELSGEFNIEMLIYPTDGKSHIVSDTVGGTRVFIEAASNKIELTAQSSSSIFDGVVPLNVFSLLCIKRIAGAISVTVGGVVFPPSASGADDKTLIINSIGGVWGGATSVPTFIGIQSDVKITDGSTLIRDYQINDNDNTIRDLVSGQDGSVINGNADDWGLFKEQPTLWKGQDLTVPPWDSVDQELIKA